MDDISQCILILEEWQQHAAKRPSMYGLTPHGLESTFSTIDRLKRAMAELRSDHDTTAGNGYMEYLVAHECGSASFTIRLALDSPVPIPEEELFKKLSEFLLGYLKCQLAPTPGS